jgi:transcription elongation factor Elf1
MGCIAAPVNAIPVQLKKNSDNSTLICTKCNVSKEFKILPASGNVPAHYFCGICGSVWVPTDLVPFH